jgi:signal transduction histidine kinase/ActR/RegA family two-component response regulator
MQPRDAPPFPALLTVSQGRDPVGRLAGLRWLVRNISERKRTEIQKRQAQKMEALGTLASGIAHDFNNILAAIIGHTQAASDSLPEPSPAAAHLREILVASKRAKDIVRQILTFSRHGRERHGPVPLHSVVAEGMGLVRASLPDTVELRLHVDPNSSMVSGNATQMHQVLLNLCANAEHAMRPRGGVLEVRVEPFEVGAELAAHHPPLSPGLHVKLTVRDTGHGIDPRVRERIFDPFFTTKGAGEGTGMGLAVVHGIVASHKGAIMVDSTPGQGTRFEILFPRYENPPVVAPVDGDRNGAGRERLLIVDDEPFLARLWVSLLESLGYRPVACCSAAEALTAFRGAPESFDLVITDLVMPEMTGDALARELLRIRPDIPIILCTGFSHTMTEEAAKAIGFRAYLEKPLGRRDLALAIRSVLGQPATPTS